MSGRRLGEIIRRQNPVTLPVTATVQQACRTMRDSRVGAILVVESDGRLAGLFTGRDVVGRVVAEGLDPATTQLGGGHDRGTRDVEAAGASDRCAADDGGWRLSPSADRRRQEDRRHRVAWRLHGPGRCELDEKSGFQEIS